MNLACGLAGAEKTVLTNAGSRDATAAAMVHIFFACALRVPTHKAQGCPNFVQEHTVSEVLQRICIERPY